jgi:glycosyltransferase involved in cell wall biosynthesis
MGRFLGAARGEAVSVVIPAYNSGAVVAEAIESVYAQTVLPGEVVVVDDGSTDDTPLILRQFEGRPGFSSLRKPNGGEASARNAGVERATGEYIAFLDHDDLWFPEKLERQLGQFDPGWGMSFTAYELMTDTPSEVWTYEAWDPDPRPVLRLLENTCAIHTCSTTLLRRDALKRVGAFEHVSPYGTDWLMWLRFAAAGNKIGYLPEPMSKWRRHRKNTFTYDQGLLLEVACTVADLYGDRRFRAWRRLLAAVYEHEHGDRRRARQRILQAAQIRPLSIRPGWVRLLV